MDHASLKAYVAKLVKHHGTNDPFSLAAKLNIVIIEAPLGELQGCYMYLKKHRTIFLNSDIEDTNLKRVVMAHEIGHAMLHTKVNCYFMQANTMLNTNKYEVQANRFAAELLISDKIVKENPNADSSMLSCVCGCTPDILNFKSFT